MTSEPARDQYETDFEYLRAYRYFWRRQLIYNQNQACFYCDQVFLSTPKGKATLEHRVPVAHGGKDHHSNYCVACYNCNKCKGMMPEDEFLEIVRAAKETNTPLKYVARKTNRFYEGLFAAVFASLKEEGYTREYSSRQY